MNPPNLASLRGCCFREGSVLLNVLGCSGVRGEGAEWTAGELYIS